MWTPFLFGIDVGVDVVRRTFELCRDHLGNIRGLVFFGLMGKEGRSEEDREMFESGKSDGRRLHLKRTCIHSIAVSQKAQGRNEMAPLISWCMDQPRKMIIS